MKNDGKETVPKTTNKILIGFLSATNCELLQPDFVIVRSELASSVDDMIRSMAAIFTMKGDDEAFNVFKGSLTCAMIKRKFAVTPAKVIINCAEAPM